ncbi:MAG TPA: hypothetical protein VKS82_22985 [Streptosporangiaceae bacterium]|nr:hypothetical protein [Streptosporangiaceae bacterium]
MSSIRPGRLRRHTAEQLLDGATGDRVPGDRRAGGEALAGLLAAASSPPRAAELAGEDAAVTAFRAEHLVPVSQSRRGQMIKSPLAKILTLKAGAMALTLGAGGAALAASTGAFTPSAHGHAHLGAASGGVSVSQHQSGTKAGVHARVPAAHTSVSGSARPGIPAVKPPLSAAGVGKACRNLADTAYATIKHVNSSAVGVLDVTSLQTALDSSVLGRVINNRQFGSLVATVENKENAADYCGLILHVAKLASPAGLSAIPASVLTAIPASVVAQVPASAMTSVPGATLGKLPIGFLSHLASKVLAGLPASVLSKLPASLLTGLLSQLPAGTLAKMPVHLLTSLLAKMPASSVTGILSKLPSGLLGQVVHGLPASLLRGLPSSLLSQLGIHL